MSPETKISLTPERFPELELPFVGREAEKMELLYQLTTLQRRFIPGELSIREDGEILHNRIGKKQSKENSGRVFQLYGPKGIGKTTLTTSLVEIAKQLGSPVIPLPLDKSRCGLYAKNPGNFFSEILGQLDKLDKSGSTNPDYSKNSTNTLFLCASRYVGEMVNECSQMAAGVALLEWENRPGTSDDENFWKFYQTGWVDRMINANYFLRAILHCAKNPMTFVIDVEENTPPGLINMIQETLLCDTVDTQHLVVLTSPWGIRLGGQRFRSSFKDEHPRQVIRPVPCLSETEANELTAAAGLIEEDQRLIYQLTGGYTRAVIAGIETTRKCPMLPLETRRMGIARTIKENFFDTQVFAHLSPETRRFIYALALFPKLDHNEIYAIAGSLGVPEDLPNNDNPFLLARREGLIFNNEGMALLPAYARPLGQYLRLCEPKTVLRVGQADVEYHEKEFQRQKTIPVRLDVLISLLGTVSLVGSNRLTNYVGRLEEEMRRLKQHIAKIPLSGEQVEEHFGKYFDKLKKESNLIAAIGDAGIEKLIRIATE